MKIVDVCAFYAPHGGGVRTYVERKLLAAPTRGHEMVVIAPGERDAVEQRGDGARIVWLAAPRFPLDHRYRFFTDREALYARLDAEAPDVVEVSSPWRSASMVADWPGRALKSLVAHSDPLSAYAYRWFGGIADRATIDRGFDWYWRHLRRLDARYDLVIGASRELTARLRAGGLRHVVTNPMGVEPARFSPTLRDPELRRRMLADCGLPDTALLLLGIGRHAPEKRWDMVAQAVTIAGAQVPVGLVQVGDGPGRAKLVRTIGTHPHIRLVAPIRDRDRLARVMASADALIHGCEAETFCFVAAEAAASGLPAIVPDRGGAADFAALSGGRTYRACDPRDAAAAIVAMAGVRRVVRRGAPRTIDDHFDDLFALYADALGRRRIATGRR